MTTTGSSDSGSSSSCFRWEACFLRSLLLSFSRFPLFATLFGKSAGSFTGLRFLQHFLNFFPEPHGHASAPDIGFGAGVVVVVVVVVEVVAVAREVVAAGATVAEVAEEVVEVVEVAGVVVVEAGVDFEVFFSMSGGIKMDDLGGSN